MTPKNKQINFTWIDFAKAIWFFLDTERKRFSLSTCALIVIFLYFMVPPYIVGRIVDYLNLGLYKTSLQPIYLSTAFLAISMIVVSWIRLSIKLQFLKARTAIGYNARVWSFQRLLEKSLTWHAKEDSGNKVTKIATGASALADTLQSMQMEALDILAKIIGTLCSFIFLDFSVFLFALAYIAVFLLLQSIFQKKVVSEFYHLRRLKEQAGGAMTEGANNIQTLKSFGITDASKLRVAETEKQTKNQELRVVTIINNKWKCFQIANGLAMGLIVFILVHKFLNNQITIGLIFPYFSYFWTLSMTVGNSTGIFDRFTEYKTAVGRLMPLFSSTEHEQKKDHLLHFPNNWQNLKFNNITFRYPSALNEFELKNINLTIPRNSKIAVVGQSGSGKSTISKLLLGLYEPFSGDISLDQMKISKVSHHELLQKVSVVPQDSELFNMSVLDNITLMSEADEELISRVIKITQLEDVIAALPNGVQTLIGEKGYYLSGGQRQRIAIARALYRQPEILVLDEATSSLDSRTEELVHRALIGSLKNSTLIIIAHRLATIKEVNQVYVIKKGELVEQGSFNDLSTNPDTSFYSIYNAQFELSSS